MAETKTIKAVDLVRRIRDEQTAELEGKSDEAILEFFHRAAESARMMGRQPHEQRD